MAVAPLLANDGLKPGAPPAVFGVLANEGTFCVKDRRVAMTPDVAKSFIADGYTMVVEDDAGFHACFPHTEYTAAGCEVVPRSEVMAKAQVIFAIEPPEKDFEHLNGKVLISWVCRKSEKGKDIVEKATKAGITLLDVVSMPKSKEFAKIDVVSGQDRLAGHRAVIEAMHAFERFYSADSSLAGEYPASKTLVIGCGGVGMEAIKKSKAYGSVVRAWDMRDASQPAEAAGATWVAVDGEEGGYGVKSSSEYQQKQKETLQREFAESDIIICTVALHGVPKVPVLITLEDVHSMKPGSVIVDAAAHCGGNCAATPKGQVICGPITNGVTIIGYTDLPSRMATQASTLYAQNMYSLVQHIVKKEKTDNAGFLPNLYKALDDTSGDEANIVERSICCCKDAQAYNNTQAA